MLSKFIFFVNFFKEYYQSVKQLVPRIVPTFVGSDLETKCLKWQNMSLLPFNYQLSKSIVHEIKLGDIAIRRMAENGFAPPPREFCRHILSCRELKAESFKRCLHSVLRGVSL